MTPLNWGGCGDKVTGDLVLTTLAGEAGGAPIDHHSAARSVKFYESTGQVL